MAWTSPRASSGCSRRSLVGPLADRVATNAPLHDPLLGSVPRSPRPLARRRSALRCSAPRAASSSGSRSRPSSRRSSAGSSSSSRGPTSRPGSSRTRSFFPARSSFSPCGRSTTRASNGSSCALGAGIVLFLIVLIYPRGLGMGDVKLSAFLGAGLGISVIVAMFVGFFVAFVPAARPLRAARAGTRASRRSRSGRSSRSAASSRSSGATRSSTGTADLGAQ